MFTNIAEEWNCPLEVINDGEVTALAGSMALRKKGESGNGVLGIAMGTSEGGGYVDMDGNITTWLSELAFAPVDLHPEAPADEWSGDLGVGHSISRNKQSPACCRPRALSTMPA